MHAETKVTEDDDRTEPRTYTPESGRHIQNVAVVRFMFGSSKKHTHRVSRFKQALDLFNFSESVDVDGKPRKQMQFFSAAVRAKMFREELEFLLRWRACTGTNQC